MNKNPYKDIEMELLPNIPLQLPFSIFRVCPDKQKLLENFKWHIKINTIGFFCFAFVLLLMIIFLDFNIFQKMMAWAIVVALLGLYEWFFILKPIKKQEKYIHSIIDKLSDNYEILKITKQELIIRNGFGEVWQTIEIKNIENITYHTFSQARVCWADIEYIKNNRKEKIEQILVSSQYYDCYEYYIICDNEKYLIGISGIVRMLSIIIEPLKSNPELDKIPFNKRYFINGY